MQRICLLMFLHLFISCDNEPVRPSFDENEIAVSYDKLISGFWSSKEDRFTYIGPACEIFDKEDGYYRIRFDDHPIIHLPDLYLDVYEIKIKEPFDYRFYFFNLKENPYYHNTLVQPSNFIVVTPDELYPSINLRLYIVSSTDSLYSIQYSAAHNDY